jgi:hypothetical protein
MDKANQNWGSQKAVSDIDETNNSNTKTNKEMSIHGTTPRSHYKVIEDARKFVTSRTSFRGRARPTKACREIMESCQIKKVDQVVTLRQYNKEMKERQTCERNSINVELAVTFAIRNPRKAVRYIGTTGNDKSGAPCKSFARF